MSADSVSAWPEKEHEPSWPTLGLVAPDRHSSPPLSALRFLWFHSPAQPEDSEVLNFQS